MKLKEVQRSAINSRIFSLSGNSVEVDSTGVPIIEIKFNFKFSLGRLFNIKSFFLICASLGERYFLILISVLRIFFTSAGVLFFAKQALNSSMVHNGPFHDFASRIQLFAFSSNLCANSKLVLIEDSIMFSCFFIQIRSLSSSVLIKSNLTCFTTELMFKFLLVKLSLISVLKKSI